MYGSLPKKCQTCRKERFLVRVKIYARRRNYAEKNHVMWLCRECRAKKLNSIKKNTNS